MEVPERTIEAYYEALWAPTPRRLSLIDQYRFRLVLGRLAPGSVLDVRTYLSDFLLLARKQGRKIAGTEINADRVRVANEMLGEKVVVQDFRNGLLSSFEAEAFENVVCMEVLEHVPDDRMGLLELCRVAKSRVIVSVPYNQRIRYYPCVHCAKYTSPSGHLHSYAESSIGQLAPDGWHVLYERDHARRPTRIAASLLPRSTAMIPILRFLDLITRGAGRWLFVVLGRPGSV